MKNVSFEIPKEYSVVEDKKIPIIENEKAQISVEERICSEKEFEQYFKNKYETFRSMGLILTQIEQISVEKNVAERFSIKVNADNERQSFVVIYALSEKGSNLLVTIMLKDINSDIDVADSIFADLNFN